MLFVLLSRLSAALVAVWVAVSYPINGRASPLDTPTVHNNLLSQY